MHEDRFGKTNGSPCQALDPCPQREMFAFDLLRVGFANGMGSRGEMPLIDPRPIRVEVLQAKGFEEFLQLDKNRIGATPERLRQHHPTQMVNGMP